MRRLFALLAIGLAVAGLSGWGLSLAQTEGPAHLPIILRDWPVTPTPTVTRAPYPFTLQAGSPVYLANIDNALGCQWFGLSGQVFDQQNRGIAGLLVQVESDGLVLEAVTGSAPKYGSSGWVIPLGGAPIATTDTYRLRLRDGGGQPLSPVVVIPTFADCNKNHIIVNFMQNH